jgi:peptidoglycan glycosyltransferase
MKFERRLWRLGGLFTLVLVLLSTRIVYWQLLRGDELRPVAVDTLSITRRDPDALQKGDLVTEEALKLLIGQTTGEREPEELPAPVVQRTRELLLNITRGAIYDRNGEVLAQDVIDEDGVRRRVYAEPSLAHVIGYLSGLHTGIAGLELTYNETLLGLDRPLAQLEQMVHQPIRGSDLHLTIDLRVQRVAAAALAGQAGAVVALDGETGAVLAMVSTPGFDPNRVNDPEYLASLTSGCGEGSGCGSLFLNRATQAVYVPGSTFKTVTLIAALDSGLVNESTVFDFGQPVQGPNGPYYVYEVDGGVIPDPNHEERELSLAMSYAKSANAAFARMADELGGEIFVRYGQRLGFSDPDVGRRFPLEIPFVPSQLANEVDGLYANNLLRAATGIGQGELLVTPLQMSLVILPALNRGDLPVPYFVDHTDSPTGFDFGGRVKGRTVRDIMKPETAEIVREMLVTSVTRGSGALANPGERLLVGGKTGTAQLGGAANPHAWFIGFAEREDAERRRVVIAVVVENAGGGSLVAAPIFGQVATAVLLPELNP